MELEDQILDRAELLMGTDSIERLHSARIIVFGVGGVGSWCVEALVRSGARQITIVDPDVVAPSNINRQLMATTLTIGRPKVEALKEHLLTVAPTARIDARQTVFSHDTAKDFDLREYDYIIDAIDSLADKALLIETATRSGARFYSSMGAALKLDPRKIRVGEFWTVKGCPLARALRQRFKRSGTFPARKFQCVYSDELVPNRGVSKISLRSEYDLRKAQINGSLMHITGIFGMTIAGLVIADIVSSQEKPADKALV